MTGSDLVNILIVDDDPDCRLAMREALEEGNIRNPVYEVEGGREALDFLYRRGEHADAPEAGLVFLDVEMPGMNGLEVLRAIRSDRNLDRVPVVMMTAVTDDLVKQEAARAGANSYAVKPLDAAEFMRLVIQATNYWIDIHRRPSGPAGA